VTLSEALPYQAGHPSLMCFIGSVYMRARVTLNPCKQALRQKNKDRIIYSPFPKPRVNDNHSKPSGDETNLAPRILPSLTPCNTLGTRLR
jgi:hypothetical protein